MEQLFDVDMEPLDFDFNGDLMAPFPSQPLAIDLRHYSVGPALQVQENNIFLQPGQVSSEPHMLSQPHNPAQEGRGLPDLPMSTSGTLGTEEGNAIEEEGRDDVVYYKQRSVRERNQVAQRKYRLKNKERLQLLERQARELSRELDRVQEEKRLLQIQTRAMEVLLDKELIGPQGPLPLEKVDSPFVPSEGFKGFNPAKKTGLILKVLFDPPRKLTHEQVLHLSLDDHRRIFRDVAFRAAKLLLANPQEDPDSPSGKQLQALYNEKHGLATYAMVWNPTLLHRLQGMGWADSNKKVIRAPDHWRTIQRLDEGPLNVVSWSVLAQALQENVDSEHITFLQLFALLWHAKDGLSVFQEARLYVESYPEVPDIPTIIQTIVDELDEEGHCAHRAEQTLSPTSAGQTQNPTGALRDLSLNDMLAEPYVPVGQRVLDALKAKAAA